MKSIIGIIITATATTTITTTIWPSPSPLTHYHHYNHPQHVSALTQAVCCGGVKAIRQASVLRCFILNFHSAKARADFKSINDHSDSQLKTNKQKFTTLVGYMSMNFSLK